MPRKSRNTTRGSRVLFRKEQRQRKWEGILAFKRLHPTVALSHLAREHSVCLRALQRKWKRCTALIASGDADAAEHCSLDRRGGHNRAFTPAQEKLLHDQVAAAHPKMTHTQIQEAALALRRGVELVQGWSARTRHSHPFHASDGFITAFKRRTKLSSHRTAVRFISAAQRDERDTEREAMDFILDARTAVEQYGRRNTLNMDETPVPKCEHPITGVVPTGSKQAALVNTDAGNRLNVTHFACISAAGDKLQLCCIAKGKTERCLKKIRTNASAAVRKVRLYYSPSGWMTTGVMLRWLEDIVKPYLHGEPGCLIMDEYTPHWTDEVRQAAERIRLQLIKVPAGQTTTFQPLDVQFNGPMAKARQRIWRARKEQDPEAKDNYQLAVERAQQAYESISRRDTRQAWIKSFILDP
jgi:hypothetical protein